MDELKEDHERELTIDEKREKAMLIRMKQLDEKQARSRSKYEKMVAVREEIRRKYPDDVMLHIIRLNLGYTEPFEEKKWVSEGLIEATELAKRKRIRMWRRDNTMDCLITAKREQEASLIDEDFQKCLIQELVIHEYKQQQKVELSRLRHAEDLFEKKRLVRMLDNKKIFENKIASKREVERYRLWMKRKEVLKNQKQERKIKRKLLYYLKSEEEKLQKWKEACMLEATENYRQSEATENYGQSEAISWFSP